MKQKLLFLIVMLAFLLPARLSAYDFESEGIYYQLSWNDESQSYTVGVTYSTGFNSYSGDIVIPASVEYEDQTYPVTSIGWHAFRHCGSLTSVEIPNSVTSIENCAFLECSSLTNIRIPNSVTSIGEEAFLSCRSLPFIKIPNSVTSIGDRAFAYCSNLRACIIMGSNVMFNDISLPSDCYVFAPDNFSTLDNPIIMCDPKTITGLADGTIFSDNGKTLFLAPFYPESNYVIPEGVTKIKSDTFYNFDNRGGKLISLESLTIPSTIEEIEPDAFKSIEIGKVNFTDWTKWYANVKLGNLYANPYWNSTPYVGGVQMVTPELPDGITEIPDYINYGLQFKNEIELPRSIKRIGAYAFYNNKELFSVILPKGLEEIGEAAFEGCELLENPSFPAGLKKIEDRAYKNCTSITEIELPESMSMLGTKEYKEGEDYDWYYKGNGVFQGCASLEKAVVAIDIDYLQVDLFRSCEALYKVYFPLQLKTIGKRAFMNCLSLEEVSFPATLEYIGEYAFGTMNRPAGHISKLIIPDGVKYIGPYSFARQSLTNISIGKGIEVIPECAFAENGLLKVINLSEGLKEIGEKAFGMNVIDGIGNSSTRGSIVIPSTVTKIGKDAFQDVTISSLVIPDEVETLPSGSCGRPSVLTLGSSIKDIDANAFRFDKLYTLRVKAHMPPTLSDAFPLTSQQNDQLTLIVNKGRFSTYDTNARWKQIDRIIEEGYTEVEIYLDGTYSLAEEIRMQSGYMPAMVTKMMVDGPLSDQDLRVIKENMVALTSLDLSNVTNLTELPKEQFKGSLLTEILLPDNLEIIGNEAFRDCRILKLEELPASIKRIGRNAFSDCPEVNIKNLPESLEHIGYQAFSNSGMREVVAAKQLSEIENEAFSNCTLLERADLSKAAINSISDYVFSGCKELDEVILPSSVKTIGGWAFSGTAFRNIDFVSEVETIGDGAFSNSRRLVSATLPESITRVGSCIFQNCPRLISVSMPMGTTEVGQIILSGDRKLANISCAAPEPPEAETGALDGLRYRYVTLAIPTLSFRKYLNSTQWGKLECIKNIIKLNFGRGVKVTNAAEKEYQEMLKEDQLEAAQEAAAQQNGGMTPARAMRRAAARANTPQNFASLFDGAQIASTDGSNNRIFITPDPGVNVLSILFDGEEMIDSFDGQSILLPEGKYGNLEIITDAKPVLAESILLSDAELSLSQADKATLTATVQPADTEDKTVKWSSSDESVATVDDNGEVTVTGVGKAMITASCGNVSSECIVKCYPQKGDANWNGNITITDAVDISNYIVKKKTAPEGWDVDEWTEFYVAGANANESGDGKITIADASATVRLALAQPAASNARSRIRTNEDTDDSVDALVIGSLSKTTDGNMSVALSLDGSREYVALQADILLPEGMNIDVKAGQGAIGHSLETMKFDDNHIRVALFNFGNKALASDNTPILEITTDSDLASADEIKISNILASDGDANEYSLVAMISGMTGVENVESGNISIKKDSGCVIVSNANGKKVEIYTMEGQLVKSFIAEDATETISLSSGLYVVKAGDKTLKVVL